MSEADAAAGVKITGNDIVTNTDTVTTTQLSGGAAKTTRQRRIQLQYHSNNGLWEQPQPRIKKASQREAAYLRASGLVPTSKSNKVVDAVSANGTTVDSTEKRTKENDDVTRHFARQLGSTDARIRHQTIRQLKAYLKVRSDVNNAGLSEMDMIKLWKCFWYTLYLADRVPVQEELSQQLCSLIWSVAGTVEQDEYIAHSYLESMNGSDCTSDEEGDYDDEDDNEDVDDECEDEVDMDYSDEYVNNDSEDDEIDFEAKQLALLKEEDEDYEDEEDDVDESSNVEADDDDQEDDEDDQEDDEDEIDEMDVQHCQGAHLASLFVRTFWRTCVREWGKMDKYRIDKFYTCLRYMLAVMYDYMALRHWSLGIIHLFNDALHEEVLLKVPNGVRYHIVDCCLEELCKASQRSSGIPLTEATFIDVLEPFFALAQTGDGDDPLQQRVVEQVLLKFLNLHSVYSKSYVNRQQERANKEKVQNDDFVFDQVHVGTISQFIFEIAADDAVFKDEYRKALYSAHKQYERRIREVGPEHDVDVEGDCGNHDEIDNDEEDVDGLVGASNDDDDDDDDDDEMEDLDVEVEKGWNDEDVVENEDDVVESKPVQNTRLKNKEKKGSNVSPTVAAKREDITDVVVPDVKNNAAFSDKSSTASTKPKIIKKEKQSNTNAAADVEPESAEEKEEVITISKNDQKAARAAMKEKVEAIANSNKRRIETNRAAELEGGTKRVKFGDNNRARSYKASMDGLTNLVVKPILQKSPERSILLKDNNKNQVIAINHQPQKSMAAQRHQQNQKFQHGNNRTANNKKQRKGRKSAKGYF